MSYDVSFPGLGLNFLINPIAFSIGNFSVRWYGIFIAIGFCLAILVVLKLSKKDGIDPNKLINCILVGLVTGIIGARLYYVIFYPGNYYLNNPIKILSINEGGLAVYGGIIGGLLGGLITARVQKVNIPSLLDLSAIGFLIGQGIGRWGNFTNQEAFGATTNLPWQMVSQNTGNVGVHPCFLYESLWCLIGFALLTIFYIKFRKYQGQVFLMYIIWYGLERFFVEGLRTDSLYIIGTSIRVSQAVAGIAVITGIVLLIILGIKNKKIENIESKG